MRRAEALAQRLHTDFGPFESGRAVQVRLHAFDQARLLEVGLRIRNLYGQIVPPWTVRPDRGIRVSDMLIGWNGIGDNPTETYIKGIDYDANAQTVDYHGDDDTRAEGAFQLARYGRPIGKKFSATVRRSV